MRRAWTRSGSVVLQANLLSSVLLLLVYLLTGGPATGTLPIPGPPLSNPYDRPDSYAPPTRLPPASGGTPGSPAVLRGKVIALDPGHGGKDFGAVGVGPTPEKVNNLAIGIALKQMLEASGARVVMTREGDYSPAPDKSDGLKARVRLANSRNAAVFLSIHNDWSPRPWVSGTTTYYYNTSSAPLARAIQAEAVRAMGSRDLGIKTAPFYVVKYTAMPAVLVELGYLSNRQEAYLLSTDAYRRRVAMGLYNGLIRYFAARGH